MKFRLISLALLAVLSLPQLGLGVLLVHEGFDYPNDAAPVVGLNGGTGWPAEWIDGGLGGGGFAVSQDDTSLTSAAFPFSASGDRVVAAGAGTGGNSMRVSRVLPSTFDMGQDGVLYASLLFKKTGSSTATSNNNMEFNLNAGTTGNGAIRFGSTSTNTLFVWDGTSVTSSFESVVLDQTYFAVLRVEASASANDRVSAIVLDPTETLPASEPVTWDSSREFNSIAVLDRVRLWIGVVAGGQFDEIRVGQTWADVTSTSTTLAGDYNSDGKVDAADYVVWRRSNSGNAQAYTDWRANFGKPGVGAGTGLGAASVPEPAGLLLLVIGCAVILGRRGISHKRG
jgi:hypothetical protein